MKTFTVLILTILFSGCGPQAFFGSNGQNGHSAVFSQVTADSTLCPTGGNMLSYGVDTNDDGVLQTSETIGVQVTCNGQNGSNGTNGVNGTNATPVTVVPLCPGVNSYPNTFIEVALCLNNQLIGVYSANDGFATVLSNGTYSSNAIGSSCSLTINGCTVTH